MSRLRVYVASSAVLANMVLLRAYYERPNFYSAAVYISQSTGSLMFLINLALIFMISFGYGLQRLFYGPLRAIETEQLYDKAWFAVSETLLAMTIFRDDIGISFFAMFLCLLAGKVWQWIGEGRVEFLEQQPPSNPRLFHTRLASSLLLSVTHDLFMMRYCIDSIIRESRPGVMVMFGFEYVLLAVASVSTLLRYTLSLVEMLVTHRQEKDNEDDDDEGDVPGWEEKGRWVFYLDLLTDFIKSVVYLGFFMILMAFYGIPIHIMRDLFMTVRSFIKRVNDFARYRNATRDMNARYPDATAEELGRENTCIVCREEMRPWAENQPAAGARRVHERQRAKKLPCGHILHFSCLRSWLERQQVCPTCRRPVLAEATTPQAAPQNNQANAAQPNLHNPHNAGRGGMFPANMPNMHQPQGGPPGQQGQQGGQVNRPLGNLRVFNLGPIRIALGNLRLPPDQQQQGQANNINNNNNLIANLAEQLAQNHNQGGQHVQNPNQAGPHLPVLQGVPMAHAHNPADIQSDILRLQHNIINSLRQLNSQHNQLEYIHALLRELNRLQQASGIVAANGQELPAITPLNPQFGLVPSTPQAYFSNGPVLRQGNAGLPEGLVLPEGWTLRPLALGPPRENVVSYVPPFQNRPPPPAPTAPAQTTSSAPGPAPGTQAPSSDHAAPSSDHAAPSSDHAAPSSDHAAPSSDHAAPIEPPPSSSEAPAGSDPATASSSKAAEPSSLASSRSFGNAAGANEGEGSNSAVAGSSSEGAARRTATVEDAEDNGQ